MTHCGRLFHRITTTCTEGLSTKSYFSFERPEQTSRVKTFSNKQNTMLKVVLKTYLVKHFDGIDRDDIKIIWKLTNAHSSWQGGVGVCSNTRIKNNCSVASDDDFRLGYRNVSRYYWLPRVTTSQEYSYLKDQVLLCSNCSLFNTNLKKWIMWNSLSPCYTLMYLCQ